MVQAETLAETKQRYKCPFYGFHLALEMLMDSKGNQCALITDSFSPCQMEISNRVPDWTECPINREDIKPAIDEIIKKFKIFPDEFYPEGAECWGGISFKQWYEHILYGNEINA